MSAPQTTSEIIRKRVTSPLARLSYPYLFTPKRGKDDDPDKFCTALLFEEGVDLRPMKQVAMDVAKSRWPEAPNLIRAGKLRWPFRDEAEDVSEKGYPEGSTFMNVSSGDNQPGVVDAALTVVTDPNQAYAGRYVFVTLTAYTYDVKGNRGVTFGLNNVQLLQHGERLDGRRAAADEFQVEESAMADLSDLDEQAVEAPEAGDTTEAEDALADLVS